MCFNATASFVAAGVVGTAGMATLPLIRRGREVPLALFGVAFGAHQLLEGIVWTQMAAADAMVLRTPVVALWLVFAWALLPFWVPLALLLVEPDGRRRRMMAVLAGGGAVVGLVLGAASFVGRVHAWAIDSHLSYVVPSEAFHPAVFAYVGVTCIPPLRSSHPVLRLWGIGLVVSMAATAVLQQQGFASVWCFFAAGLSVLVLVHFVRLRRSERSTPTPTPTPQSDAYEPVGELVAVG